MAYSIPLYAQVGDEEKKLTGYLDSDAKPLDQDTELKILKELERVYVGGNALIVKGSGPDIESIIIKYPSKEN